MRERYIPIFYKPTIVEKGDSIVRSRAVQLLGMEETRAEQCGCRQCLRDYKSMFQWYMKFSNNRTDTLKVLDK